MRRLSPIMATAFLAVVTSICACPRVGLAATSPSLSIDAIAQAWMGTVALLADDDGDRRGGWGREHGDRDHARREHGEREHSHREHGDRCDC